MEFLQVIIKNRTIRSTPVDDRAFFHPSDNGSDICYNLGAILRIAPAFKIGSRRYNSHLPLYRRASFDHLTNQYYDRELPFARFRSTKRKFQPLHIASQTVPMPKSENLWSHVPKDDVCAINCASCSCGFYGPCYVSLDWCRPQDPKCSDCIRKMPPSSVYPYDFPSTIDGVIDHSLIKYTGYADVFMCELCGLLMGVWHEDDIPALQHNYGSPYCVKFSHSPLCDEDSPLVTLFDGIKKGVIPPVEFSDEFEDDVCISTIRCGDFFVSDAGLSKISARVNAARLFLSKFNYSSIYPTAEMFSLSSLPYESFPIDALDFAVEQGIVPPLSFLEEMQDDMFLVTISCSLLTVADVGLTQLSARENAARRFLCMFDFSDAYPTAQMFALSTIPQQSSETLQMANATLNHINDVFDRHDGALIQVRENVEVKLSDITRQVGSILPKVEHTLDDVSSTLSSFKSVLEKISAWMPSTNPQIIDLIKELFVSLFFAILTKSLTPIVQGISGYALRCNLFVDHLSALSAWLMTLRYNSSEDDDVPETQGFMDDLANRVPDLGSIKGQATSIYESIGTGLCVALSGILSFIAIVCLGITDFSSITFNKLLTQSSLVGRALVGVRSFKDVFFGIWEYVDNQVCQCLYGQDRKSLDLLKDYPKLTSLLSIFNYFHDTVDANVLISCNRAACDLLVKADNLYQGYLDKALTLGNREISARLKEARLSVKQLIESAHVYLTCGDGSRIPPVVVYMYGEAGCGKTELSTTLQEYFARTHFPQVPQKDLVYSRKAENEFWDGVKQSHKIITYDDVLQIVDSPQKPNPEIFEFIRLNNSDPYQVHMSNVKDKANTFISPSFILATSNVNPDTYAPRSIHSVDAFRRRLDVCVHVDVRDDFARFVPGINGQRKVPCERKIWLHQNPGKTVDDMRAEITAGTYKINNETAVYELSVSTTLAGATHNEVCTYDRLIEVIERVRTLRMAAHSNKVETELPTLPDTLNELAESVFPSAQSNAFCFSTDWLGSYSSLTESLSHLNETFSPIFVSRADNPSCMYISPEVIDGLLHSKFSGTLGDETIAFMALMNDIPDRELSASLATFVNGNIDGDRWTKSVERSSGIVNACKNAWTRVYEFLCEHWVAISAVVGAAIIIGGSSVAYMCAADCNVKRVLSEGGSLLQLVGARSCMCACDLCKRIKKGDLNLRVRNRSDGTITFVPSDVRRVARHIISSADACKVAVHHTFALSVCEESFTIHNDTSDMFSILDCNLESHQDVKPKSTVVESHQDLKPKTVVVESHQDITPRVVSVESHQDMKLKNHVVEGTAFDYTVDWSDLCVEDSVDSNAQDVSSKILSKNFVRVYRPGTFHYTHGLFVCGRMLLMPKHLYDRLDGCADIVSIADGGNVRVPVSIKSCKPIERSGCEIDMVICELGASISARKDITSYFPTVNELSSMNGLMSKGDMRIFTTASFTSGSTSILIPRDSVATYVTTVDHIETRTKDHKPYYIRQGFEARGNSKEGDCCSPYILFNPSSRAKIVGLHCAGFAKTSRIFAQTITQEDISSALPTTHAGCVSTEFPFTSLVESPLPNSLAIGSVKTAPSPTKSEIIESPIYGCFPIRTAPAKLHCSSENLLIKNAMKVTKNVVLLEDDLIDMCVHDVKRVLNAPGVSDVEKRVLSHEESITGIEGRQYMNALNRSTSAGFPYNSRKCKGKPGKQTWLGSGEFIVDNPDVKEHVETIIEKARAGIVDVSLGIFTATLKDERRPLEKVQANKTRVFAASNQGLALALRRYYLCFLDHVMTNRIDNEIGLGVNVYSYDWTRIVNKLKRVGNKVIAGDFSNFDGSLNSQILSCVSDIVTDWYGDYSENGLVRHVLLEYLFNATWLLNGKVFQLNHSQPSGNPLTTIINCVYNMIIFRYIYLLAQRENDFPLSLSGFGANVACVFYGDDSLCSISNKVCDWFNQHVITRLMSSTGHEYTDETKTGSPPPYRSISEVTFLKREFVFRDSFWIAPLSKHTIEDMCMWSKKNIESQEALLQTTRVASFEASLHGDAYLFMFSDIIRKACRAAGFKEACLHRFECRNFLLAQQGRGGAHDSEFLSMLLDMTQ